MNSNELMSLREPFCFLEDSFEGASESPSRNVPVVKTLYVNHMGALIRRSQGRIIVETEADENSLDFPEEHIRSIVVFGATALTSGARDWALREGKDVHYLSYRGSYLGSLSSAHSIARGDRLRQQLSFCQDAHRSLELSREILRSKVHHQITLLRRYNYREKSRTIERNIEAMVDMCGDMRLATTKQELMGFEGSCARVYFHSLSRLAPEELRFEKRTRRPPLDIFNAALSYGYAILLAEATSALISAGLEPGLGVLHTANSQNPRLSLALDFVEEFRPYVVDLVVLQLTRRNYLTNDHGEAWASKPGGVLLNREGKRVVLNGYENRMIQVQKGAIPAFSGSVRRIIYRQAERLMLNITESEPYRRILWR
ncbi:CRISPR-associated endonuclease Cas1 [Corynebacterium sp. ES2794-CONJ1]|uniref:CRISPR-associated endonuclease Cas1 n=1 Tax=Corynebacterium sp. ES2794-CONJ1 TaxID=2980553 RepID=UPI0021DB4313|nr:CRISPR-associated endonuclease Cas1 [Corynebacterium sp. ES2794-CONJ1]MCU9518920.1 CRISPR-associated endonuclease Cas1 [Corynebacterium sp. ES2794-CONJ1]